MSSLFIQIGSAHATLNATFMIANVKPYRQAVLNGLIRVLRLRRFFPDNKRTIALISENQRTLNSVNQ
jgi:hypothetical protein